MACRLFIRSNAYVTHLPLDKMPGSALDLVHAYVIEILSDFFHSSIIQQVIYMSS